jgi:hypothetical protein
VPLAFQDQILVVIQAKIVGGEDRLASAVREWGNAEQVMHKVFVFEHICDDRDRFNFEYPSAYGR